MGFSSSSRVSRNALDNHSSPPGRTAFSTKGTFRNLHFIIEYPILLRAGDVRDKSNLPSPPIVLRDETSLPRQTPITVLALGGNAILQRNQEGTFEEQYENVKSTATQKATLVNNGFRSFTLHRKHPPN